MSEHDSASSFSQQGTQHDGAPQAQQTTTQETQPQQQPAIPFYHAQPGSSLGHSVVPDLMKVYESLTHSSTPQAPAGPQQPMSAPPNVPPSQFVQQQPMGQQQQSQQYQSSQYGSSHPPPFHQAQYHPNSQYVPQPQNNCMPPSPNAYDHKRESTPNAEGLSSSGAIVTSRGRRSRKRSLDSGGNAEAKNRKKGSATDGRWSKRFTWPEDLHRDFVSAIFDVGLKHASPSALLEFMPKHDQITSERVKSHLQKYRVHREKSKKEFMSSYEASVTKFQNGGVDITVKSLSSAEVASHLAYSTMMDTDETTPSSHHELTNEGSREVQASQNQQEGAVLTLPNLTEAEKHSSIGTSMGYLVGLFLSLRQQLMEQRAQAGYGVTGAQNRTDANTGLPVVTDSGSANTTATSGVAQPVHQQQVARADLSVTWSTSASQVSDVQQQPQSLPDGVSQDGNIGDGKAQHPGGQHLISSSTRSNVEENNLMKREMQSQMAFQNKMRALKQQELNKYRNAAEQQQAPLDGSKDMAMEGVKGDGTDGDAAVAATEASQYAGQTAGAGGAASKEARGMSFGNPDDFWSTGDVDDHLFEFLMNS